jgi:hypothetical protein
LLEELGADSDGLHVATLENIFTYEGEPSHELALIYECALRDERVYSLDRWDVDEATAGGLVSHRLAWRPVAAFRSGDEILYPDGVVPLLDDPSPQGAERGRR